MPVEGTPSPRGQAMGRPGCLPPFMCGSVRLFRQIFLILKEVFHGCEAWVDGISFGL